MALSPARRLSALTSTLRCQGGDEISKISFAPKMRIDAQLEMLTQDKRYRYLLVPTVRTVLAAGTTSVYLYLAQQDPRTMVLDNRTRSVGLKDLIL